MKNRIINLLFFLSIFLSLGAKPQSDRYVVVLSMDAFRWDYPQIYHTPTLDSLAKVGVSSRFIPCFPTITFPNHYSMATGLHPNNHGIVHNTFYDSELDRVFKISDRSAVQDPAFYGGEPIWLTAHKHGFTTASFCWVGSEAPIGGYQPTPWKKFDGTPSFEARADSVISWLSKPNKERPHLIMWYFEEPDAVSHHYTPFSEETRMMIERLDSIIGVFLDKARRLPHFDNIDFIFLGDHGMSTYQPERNVNLADYFPRDSFSLIVTGPITHLYPKSEELKMDILEKFKEIPYCKAWAKEDLPARFCYGASARIGDIVVLADSASMIVFTDKFEPKRAAAHGYDNAQEDMGALFRAAGPSFKQGVVVKPMLNLNLYKIIANILNLKEAPNDGESKSIEPMFVFESE